MSAGGQLLAHLAGDYLVQSDWMAQEKTQPHGTLPAALHAASYAACFLPLTRNPARLAVIGGTHFVVDRWRLAKHVVYWKNQFAPERFRYSQSHAEATGYHGPIDLVADAKETEQSQAGIHSAAICQETFNEQAKRAAHHTLTQCPVPPKPDFMAVWLLIIADNAIHGLINAVALRGT